MLALRSLARRIEAATAEADELEREIRQHVRALVPELLDAPGVGPIVAAQLIVSWSHHDRLRSEAAFARLAGVAPLPAFSGQTIRRCCSCTVAASGCAKIVRTIVATNDWALLGTRVSRLRMKWVRQRCQLAPGCLAAIACSSSRLSRQDFARMTRWSAITRTRGRRSALAYGSRSTTAAEDNLNRLVHHERGRYCPARRGPGRSPRD